MISADQFCGVLARRGYSTFTGVPCSTFKHAINFILDDPDSEFVMAANEGAALAIASGAWLAGRKAAVVLQNSGSGNLVNPLTSLNASYTIPAMLFVSARAYPDGMGDEPQHRLIGATVRQVLDAFGVLRFDMPETAEDFERVFTEADKQYTMARRQVAIMVPVGAIGAVGVGFASTDCAYPLSRRDAVAVVVDAVEPDDAVVSTTGMISRALFAVADRPLNFYMQGSMGHARAIGLGVALSAPDRRVFVIDGDGAALMHLGTMSTVGHYAPRNLIDIVLDNEAHGSTGYQKTTATTTDLASVARACGYRWCASATTERALVEAIERARSTEGPSMIHVKINCVEPATLPRITTKHSHPDNARAFRASLVKPRHAG